MTLTTFLSAALRGIVDADASDPVLHAGVGASARTLNEGVVQWTREARDPELIRKHRARLRAALRAMADALEEDEP